MIEILAVIFTLICVWLATKRHILSWPIGITGVILYSIVFWETKLYSDFGLQFIFLFQSIYGWIIWIRNKERKTNQVSIEKMKTNEKLLYFFTTIIGIFFLGILMKNYTDASVPYIDAFVALTSLTANWLLANRKLESWYLWVLVDIVYIGLFLYKELYFSAGLYTILFFIALKGLLNWESKYKKLWQ